MTTTGHPSVAAAIHSRWVEAAGDQAGTVDIVTAAFDAAIQAFPSGTWYSQPVARFVVLALVEHPESIAEMVDSEDARLRPVGQVLYDLADGWSVPEEAVDAAVLAAARVLAGVQR